MAKGGKDEHRMVFDIRGRRKNVVKVVYGILALLMGLSLLLVVGPAPLADIFGTKDEISNAAKQYEEQAERIEVKLAKDPEDADLLLNLTRAQVNAANQLSEQNPTTGAVVLTTDARQQLEQASSSWSDYLEAADEPSGNLALIMSNALYSLASTSGSGPEAEANIKGAAEAQKIVAEQRPSVNSLTTLALYTLYTFDYAAAEKAKEEAEDLAVSKEQRKQIAEQYEAVVKSAKEFEKEQAERKKLERELPNQGGQESQGGQENPFGGALGGGSSLSE